MNKILLLLIAATSILAIGLFVTLLWKSSELSRARLELNYWKSYSQSLAKDAKAEEKAREVENTIDALPDDGLVARMCELGYITTGCPGENGSASTQQGGN